MTRMQRQIRLAYYHDKRHTDDPEDGEGNYNPKIYLKSTWNDIPKVERNDVEWRMMSFADELTKRSEELKKNNAQERKLTAASDESTPHHR